MTRLGVLGLALIVAGCSSSPPVSEQESRARRHLELAERFEAVGELKEATVEYVIVAEMFPDASMHRQAMRKAAMLHAHPSNPERNDSLSLHWFSKYLELPLTPQEKTEALYFMALLERISMLRDALVLERASKDSIRTMAEKQSGELAAKTKRIQDVEQELKHVQDELKRLREVDVKLEQRKVNK